MKHFVHLLLTFVLTVVLIFSIASAAIDYLAQYSDKVSKEAYDAADRVTPIVTLTGQSLSLYKLGYAAGWDAAKTSADLESDDFLDSFKHDIQYSIENPGHIYAADINSGHHEDVGEEQKTKYPALILSTLPPSYIDMATPRTTSAPSIHKYIANKWTMKFHNPTCEWAQQISVNNRLDFTCTRQEMLNMGYSPCKVCLP